MSYLKAYVDLSALCMSVMSPASVYGNKINVVELSGTGVPPSLLGEVQERRSGASRGAGAAYTGSFRLKLSTGYLR